MNYAEPDAFDSYTEPEDLSAYADELEAIETPNTRFIDDVESSHENTLATKAFREAEARSAADHEKVLDAFRLMCGPGERLNEQTMEIEPGDPNLGTPFEGLYEAMQNRVTHAPGGGGSKSSGSKKKPNKPTDEQRKAKTPQLEDKEPETTTIRIRGLTRGERQYAASMEPRELRDVFSTALLTMRAAVRLEGETVSPPSSRRVKPRKPEEVASDLLIHGMLLSDATDLAAAPRLSLTILRDYLWSDTVRARRIEEMAKADAERAAARILKREEDRRKREDLKKAA